MLEPGHTLGRYRVEEQLGAGGMGEVYRAWDSVLRRWIALKVVPKASSHAERLLGEARAAAALRHANIVSVYDVGEDDGYAFVSMDLVEGRPLRDYVGDTSIAFDKQLGWLMQIANALRAAHKAGFIHRDMKPDNVMVGTDGDVRVLDFGLAKAFSVDVDAPTAHSDGSAPEAFRTAEGRVSGTPAYMAPEQLAGAPPSPAWDQYAWGVLACELLSGKHPRIAGLVSVSGWVKPESMEHVPPAVGEVVARAMAPSPDQRFPSMEALVAALGGPVSGAATFAPAPSNAPANAASVPSATMNVAVGDTLQVPVHPNAPPGQRSSRSFAWIAGGAAVLAVSVGVAWRLRVAQNATTAVASPGSPSVAATTSVVTGASAAPSAAATSVASGATVAAVTGGAAVTPGAGATSADAPAAPVVHVAARKKLTVSFRINPTLQYETRTIERAVAGLRPLVKQCVEQHVPRTLPAIITVDLELWGQGDRNGDVRDVRVREPTGLSQCLRDVFAPVSLGPPKTVNLPASAVFVGIVVDPAS